MTQEERLTTEELEAIRKRVEEAREYGHGVGELALGDVPKLLTEIAYLKDRLEGAHKYSDAMKEILDGKQAEVERLRKVEEGACLLLEQVNEACGKVIPAGAFTAGRMKLVEALRNGE